MVVFAEAVPCVVSRGSGVWIVMFVVCVVAMMVFDAVVLVVALVECVSEVR